MADPTDPKWFAKMVWLGTDYDKARYERGLCFKINQEEEAVAKAKEMLNIKD